MTISDCIAPITDMYVFIHSIFIQEPTNHLISTLILINSKDVVYSILK